MAEAAKVKIKSRKCKGLNGSLYCKEQMFKNS